MPQAMRVRRSARLLVGLAATLAALGGLPPATGALRPATGATGGTAGVIVETGAATYRTLITVPEAGISGIEALRRAGADPVIYSYAGLGAAVCMLHGVGRPSGPNCLGGADGDPRYWAYFRAPAGTDRFAYARVGAGATLVRPGDVEGWRWGTGQAPTYVPIERIGAPAPTTTRPPATTRPPTTTTPPGPPPDSSTPAAPPPGDPDTRGPTGGPQVTPGPGAPGRPAAGDGTLPSSGGADDPAGRSDGTGGPGGDGSGRDRPGGRDGADRSPDRTAAGVPPAAGDTPSRGGPPVGGYLLFALLTTGLGAGIVAARRRRADGPAP